MHDEIEILYERFGPMVFRRCQSLLGNEEDAMDITQDVFVKLLSKKELNIDTPSSFLYVAATRHCLNHIRSKKRKGEHNARVEEIASIDFSNENRSLAGSVLRKLFYQYPESTRLMAVLHYHDGYTLEETATAVGMSVSGVRKRLNPLRQQLRKKENP